MHHIQVPAWYKYWAGTKKGTAAGASQMSVNMVWALQRSVPTPAAWLHKQPAPPAWLPLQPGAEVCHTEHIFEGMRCMANMIIDTGMVPSPLLAEVLCPLDKVPGKVDLNNKRPIRLC